MNTVGNIIVFPNDKGDPGLTYKQWLVGQVAAGVGTNCTNSSQVISTGDDIIALAEYLIAQLDAGA